MSRFDFLDFTCDGAGRMQLRQVALVARDLEAVVADLGAVLGIEVAFRDPDVAVFGLQNAVIPIGDTFLEVVSPTRADTTAGRFLTRRGGDGGYMAIFQCADVDRERERVASLGMRVAWSIDLPEARTIHLHPRDVGGAIVSLDSMTEPGTWHWAGPDWRAHVRTDVISRIAGLELEATDPVTLSARWAGLLRQPSVASDTGAEVRLDHSVVRFVASSSGRGDGISGIDLMVRDRERVARSARERGLPVADDHVVICGTRLRFKSVDG